MRQFLLKSKTLQREVDEERRKSREFVAQLRQQQQSTAAIRRLMRGMQLDDWFWKCERWRAITAEYFKPFPVAECKRMVEQTMRAIATYKLPEEVRGDKPSVFGWRDVRGLGGDHQRVHFNTRKTHYGSNLDEVVATCWRIYQDEELFHELMTRERAQLFFQIMQQETLPEPESNTTHLVVLQTVEKYRGLPTMAHFVYLLFLKKTKTGYLIGVRCIDVPDLQRVMHRLSQGGTFYWTSWDVTAWDEATGKCTEFVTKVSGFIGASDPAYAQKWVVEHLLALVRLETKLYGAQPLVSLPPPAAA